MDSRNNKIKRIGYDVTMENAKLKKQVSIYKKKLLEAHVFMKETVR